ncbi:MAG TPA: hypothetical protein VEY05_06830 [Beijerinckiaceae bacterium]|nr:hypothetical protein [Beijerinckiaceae bacterium]
MELLYFLFGPLLLLVVFICADMRGGPMLQTAAESSRSGLRYVALVGFLVTVVGIMAAIPKKG